VETKVRNGDIEFGTHRHDRSERIIFGHNKTVKPLQPWIV
jgi:hypothetical protein